MFFFFLKEEELIAAYAKTVGFLFLQLQWAQALFDSYKADATPEVWRTERMSSSTPEGSEASWGPVADTLELSWGWDISGLAAEEGGVPLTNAHSEVGELLIAMQYLSCRSMKHFRDWGSSNSWECDCNSIKVENDGSLALDQKQIGGRYVINYTLFISFWRWTFCLLVNL